jgi:hypothetical protein
MELYTVEALDACEFCHSGEELQGINGTWKIMTRFWPISQRLVAAGTFHSPCFDKWRRRHRELTETSEHKSVDGYPVVVGAKFWNNDLRVCQVTEVASHSNAYASTGATQTWHKTDCGSFDTLTDDMAEYGRLTRYFQGLDAEKYESGTKYSEVSGGVSLVARSEEGTWYTLVYLQAQGWLRL